MGRDQLTRMDLDTAWIYHRHWRAIQREDPEGWPVHAVAWLALLGEAWKGQDRNVTLEEAWPAALRSPIEATRTILTRAALLDKAGKIPRASWDEWFGPTLRRIQAGQKGANARWGTPAMPSDVRPHSGGNANSHPASQPIHPSSSGARKRERGSNGAKMERVGDVAAAMGFGDTYPDGTPRKGLRPDA